MHTNDTNKKPDGFTLIETIITVAILGALALISLAAFSVMQSRSELNNNAQEFLNILKFAQNRTIASEAGSRYGVYLNTSVSPHQYIMFKGASYATRDAAFDQIYNLSKNAEFYSISLGGQNEVVFEKISGYAAPSGNVSIRLKTDNAQSKTIYISAHGAITFEIPSVDDLGRTKDSRHVHFDYSRVINTNSENVVLNFNSGTVIKTLPIVTNMAAGQFYWSGKVSVGGVDQVVKIHTHRLNNPDTQFSVHRDRRFNNKSLDISISGDTTGDVAKYSADGLTTSFVSVYVVPNSFIWQ
ncbi:MAG: type II secretion system protein [Patescibacteria group bacterium]